MTWTSSSAPYLTPPGPGSPDAWTQAGGGQKLLEVGVVEANEEVRAALGLEPGAQVVRRTRLILREGEPIEQATSYWPAAWAADTALAGERPVKGGTVRLLADLGWRVAQTIDDLDAAETASAANAPMAPAGTPLLTIRRTAYDQAEVPFEYCVMHIWDGHRQRYVVEVG